MRLLLVRHGESTWNATGRWQGQSDVPLSPRGQLQARAVAGRLFGAHFDARLTSDLSRAAETAAAIGGPSEPEPRLREIDVGEWAGLKRTEVAARFPDQVKGLREGAPVRIGGGEAMPEFEARVDGAVDELRARHAGQRVLVVTHGGVIRALTTRVLGVRERTSPLVGVANTSVSVVRDREGALELVTYNDAQHLDAADQDSSILQVPEPITRVALVACASDEKDRRLTDAILAGLGIAQYYATADVAASGLADELLADPVPEADAIAALARLSAEHAEEAFGLLASPSSIRHALASTLALGRPEGLALAAHGAIAQLRISARGAVMYSYGVMIGDADPLA